MDISFYLDTMNKEIDQIQSNTNRAQFDWLHLLNMQQVNDLGTFH